MLAEEEKEFFIYEDYEDVDVDYSVRDTSKNPKETIVGIKGLSAGKKGYSEVKKPVKKEEKKEKPKEEIKKEVKEEKKAEKKEEKKPVKVEVKEEKKIKKEKKSVVREVKEGKVVEKREAKKEEKEKKPKRKKTATTAIIIAIAVLLVIVLLILYFKVWNQNSDKNAAALVNNEVISFTELEEGYNAIPEVYKMFMTKEQILDQLIEQKLLLQEARKRGIVVTEKEIDDSIAEILEQNMMSEEDLDALLKEGGMTMKEIRDSDKMQITINKLLEQEVYSKIPVNESEIKEYYDNMIRASHILVASEEEAKKILGELKNGADFEELAKENSIDTISGVRGGDLGEFGKGQMVPEFEDAAFNLKVGEISGIVVTDYGYHIIKRTEKNLTYEEIKDKIKDLLSAPKQEEAYRNYVADLRAKAKIVINLAQEETETAELEEIEAEIGTVDEVTEEISPKTCYEEFGASSDTIIFYYADWCMEQTPCKNAKSAVENLQKQGYKFKMERVGSDLMGCFEIENKNAVPQFICAKTGEAKVGSVSEAGLKSFADSCK